MSLTKILTYVFLAIAIGIAYYLFDRIKFSIEEEERIAQIESQVMPNYCIKRLTDNILAIGINSLIS